MSSTYSTNLRLELIAPGEQANTWGNTTNNNLGTLIEQSITGITTIDISAGNVTLTSLNGAFDQARSMIIDVAGASAVARTVFTPANVAKVYIVNNTTNADVIMSTLAAGTPTTVTVVAGASMLVFTDGTDFFEGSNSANVFTADTVTITGTPSASTDAITVGYATTQLGNYLPKAGGTMSGAINMGTTNKITNMATPTSAADAATKQYVDTVAGGSGFGSGTTMLFYQQNAPSGWTKLITQNDKAIRVVSGSTGGTSSGSVAFSTAFALQSVTGSVSLGGLSATATTLSESQMPSHSHASPGDAFVLTGGGVIGTTSGSNLRYVFNTASTGGGGSHSHSVSGSASFSGNAINLAVQYIDIILCSKD